MAQRLPVELERADLVSYDPATGEEVGRAPLTMPEEVAHAVIHAREAQAEWASLAFRDRAKIVMKAREIVLKELEQIALLISRETGKPIAEAVAMELTPTLDLMQYFARRTESLLMPERIPLGQYGLMGRLSYTMYKPLGVVGIISPWNFPWATPLDEVVMALMAGNAVVLKPSELTPLTGLKIKEVFARAGLADGLLEVVIGDGSVGAAVVGAGVDKIMFTGSVATGKRVAEAAARYLIPVVLELGGKDPMVVLEDADIRNSARAAVWGAFANSGQACASVERCYVHESIAPQFIEEVVAETKRLHQGIGVSRDADIGSMTSEDQLEKVESHVRGAKIKGATVLIGGQRRRDLKGPFFEPTVLTNVNHEMDVMCEETFGPVLPIMTFQNDDEAVSLANDSHYGLTASVWTKNIARGERLAESIEAGTVMVNEVLYTHGIAQTPWGGVKESGFGRTHGSAGLFELVSPRHIHVNRWPLIPDLWWFNYTPLAGRLFRGFARRFASGSVLQTALLVPLMIRRFFEKR
jgi:acyl-CoA reductase-like NAD-dependent aldehyde dehydrogenase